jgi:hypothetical protein
MKMVLLAKEHNRLSLVSGKFKEESLDKFWQPSGSVKTANPIGLRGQYNL